MTANLLRQREDPTWLAATAEWVEQKMAERGIALTSSPAEVRVLPWSAVYRFPTMTGDVYFKACAPSQGFEPALMCYLAERRPGDVLPVLAADLGRAWLLMPDGGPVLEDVIEEDAADVARHWSAILSRLASLQIDLSGDAGRLLALGVLDRRPAVLPALYRELLERTDRWPVDHPSGLGRADLPRLHALTPRLEALCAELTASGPADTLIHDDLHDGHVFVQREANGPRYTFFDYGDACIGHPFVQQVSTRRFWRRNNNLKLDDATVKELHTVYLQAWGMAGESPTLWRTLQAALAIGAIIRALTWFNALGPYHSDLSVDLRAAYACGLADWLREFEHRSDELIDG